MVGLDQHVQSLGGLNDFFNQTIANQGGRGDARDAPQGRIIYLYVMNGRNEQVHILDHASGKILSSFGRPGHQLANFTHGHALAVDSKGNIYIAETDTGRRIQKFRLVDGA